MRFLISLLLSTLLFVAACDNQERAVETNEPVPVADAETVAPEIPEATEVSITISSPISETSALSETATVSETEPMSATGELDAPMALTTLLDAEGTVVGDATLTETEEGVVIQVTLREFMAAASGEHGLHIHAVGACTPDFQAAGDHFNPTAAAHGMENPAGAHAGDLPNVTVDTDGNAIYQATNTMITLAAGEGSLFDEDGSALVLHADPDDLATDPAGNSGDRIACGVIEMQ